MNRIVRENYPVSQLPEDLRHELPGRQSVTLTIDWNTDDRITDAAYHKPEHVKSLEELFAMAEPTFRSLDDVAAHVRRLRDEWS